jgi:hypothetical protein
MFAFTTFSDSVNVGSASRYLPKRLFSKSVTNGGNLSMRGMFSDS